MKKLFSILMASLVLAVSFSASAQSPVSITPSKTTLTNSDTAYAVKSFPVPVDKITLQAVLNKTSGTIAGTVLPQGSLDGTNYVNISTDTLTLANQSVNTKIWTFDKRQYYYYRLRFNTTGTSVAVPVAYILTSAPPSK